MLANVFSCFSIRCTDSLSVCPISWFFRVPGMAATIALTWLLCKESA
jgi:hypothetical protein